MTGEAEQRRGDTIGGGDHRLVLPYPYHRPSLAGQAIVGVTIAGPVGFDLGPPPFGIVLWPGTVKRTAVPEAAVDEDRYTRTGEDDIDRAAATLKQPPMQSEA